MNKSRRALLAAVPAAAVVLLTGRHVSAQGDRVDEQSPAAVGLGYKHNAADVDAAKYSQFVKGDICATCKLYAGTPSDPWAPCGAFGGKQVNANGWCIAYAKKA